MSTTNDIAQLLNIQDKNIFFKENCVKTIKIKGVETTVVEANLTYTSPDICPICGCKNENNAIIKNGTKLSNIKLPKASRLNTILKLHKQRFLCRNCNHTFSASSSIVNTNCFISNNTKLSIVLDAKKKRSEKDIGLDNNVSHSTVNKIIHSLYKNFKIIKNHLPKHISFDEFKSVKSVDASMSFIFINNENNEIINILEDRRLNQLIRYFMSYSRQARLSVQTVCMDMYSPYISLVKKVFPNAEIITDKFHIVQLISRSLNKTRINAMKTDKTNYNKLKRYWKLILKNRDDLDDNLFRHYTCFSKLMREVDIVDYIIDTNEELKETYYLYQDLLYAIKKKKADAFYQAIESASNLISDYMKTSIKTLKEYKKYISNSFIYVYTNGAIEGTNNLIKVIKRIAFGYKSFVQFKIRILLITNTMVKFKLNKEKGNLSAAF